MAERGGGGTPAPFSVHNFFTDSIQPVLGAALLAVCAPLVAANVALSGLLAVLLPQSLLAFLFRHPALDRAVAVSGDGFIAAAAAWLCCVVPLLCLHEVAHAAAHGFSPLRAVLYNVIRIGPTYGGFAWAYTLAHKEAHAARCSLFVGARAPGLFNYVAGPFFGIVPGTFTVSHLTNHHRYHNSKCDVYSTGGYARDSLMSFCRYIVTWLAYASNASTAAQLLREGRGREAALLAAATAYYFALVGAVAWVSPAWAAASLGWAFFESNVLLAMVNWVWHCMISPTDPTNPFIVSTTIVRGQQFILAEEYHAVHHALPGAHHTAHEPAFEKTRAEYEKAKAVVFQDVNLFVVWGKIVAGDYAGLAALAHDPGGAVWGDRAALPAEIMARLRHCTW